MCVALQTAAELSTTCNLKISKGGGRRWRTSAGIDGLAMPGEAMVVLETFHFANWLSKVPPLKLRPKLTPESFHCEWKRGSMALIATYVNHGAFCALSDWGVNGLQRATPSATCKPYFRFNSPFVMTPRSCERRVFAHGQPSNELCCSRFCLMC